MGVILKRSRIKDCEGRGERNRGKKGERSAKGEEREGRVFCAVRRGRNGKDLAKLNKALAISVLHLPSGPQGTTQGQGVGEKRERGEEGEGEEGGRGKENKRKKERRKGKEKDLEEEGGAEEEAPE